MENIRNYREYRTAWEMLNIYAEMIAEHGFENIEKAKNRVIETKRAIRKYRDEKDERHIVRDYGIDGFVELVELPNGIENAEQAEEYCETCLRIEAPYSAYDCTGAWFTSWIKPVERGGKWYAYHRISVDV